MTCGFGTHTLTQAHATLPASIVCVEQIVASGYGTHVGGTVRGIGCDELASTQTGEASAGAERMSPPTMALSTAPSRA